MKSSTKTTKSSTPNEIRLKAKGLWPVLLPDLAPQLKEAVENLGHHVPCPMHGGKDGFRLFPDAPETGGGICNTCGSFPDGVSLLVRVNGWSHQQVVEAIEAWLVRNGQHGPKDSSVPDKGPNSNAQRQIERITEEADEDPGRVSEYLQSRGLSGEVPESLRFHPALPLFAGGEKVGNLPAMVAPYQRDDGQIVGYQRLYLDPDGMGKADIETPKKNTAALWNGALSGAIIRLSEPREVLGIAEGIETALAVQEATGMPVWAAGSAGGLEAAELPDEVCSVHVWGDNDQSGRGEEAALKLTERLLLEGRTVKVSIPQEIDHDWLDVLNQHGPEAVLHGMEQADCYELLDEEEGKKPSDDFISDSYLGGDADQIVAELNQRHFVVNFGGRVCIANQDYDPQMDREDLSLSSVADFRLRYSNRFYDSDTTYAKLWLSHPQRRQYNGIVFLPGQEAPGYFNLFRGFPVPPTPGDASLYWDHVQSHICNGNEVHYKFVRRWMAHAVQKPHELPGTAIVLRGLQGTGKGVYVENFGALFGIHYVTVYRLDQVTGRFNSHQKNILLLHANEATCCHDKVSEGVIKGLITDHQVPIEYKGKDIISIRNYKRIIVATNEDWAVPMGMDDRRFLVLDVNPAKKEDKEYFKAIAQQMENGGLEALMHDLLTEDLTGFDVRTVPFSASNFDQKLHSSPPIIQWWFDCLCDGRTVQANFAVSPDGWNTQPSHDELFTTFTAWCRESRLTPLSKPTFGRAFRKLLPGLILGESRRLIHNGEFEGNGKRQRVYILPSLEECREAFQRFSKTGPEIWPENSQE